MGLKLPAVLVAATAAWAIVSVVNMTYGTVVNWPDFLHANFGFPLTYATHTLNTIMGPADKWSVDVGALTADLAFWFIGMFAMVLLSVAAFSNARGKESAH